MKAAPKASVVVITYNHENYIRQALASFVAQEASFDFEVVIADDCSADNTPKIIAEYAKKYSNIRPILRRKNIGPQNNSIDALRAARGEYIALCEGDDFWSDPEKLQRQVDFMEQNPDCALCFHPVRIFFENHKEADSFFPDVPDKSIFTVDELLKWNFIQTNSVMYRRQDYGHLPNDVLPLDWYYHLYHAQFGRIGFIDRVMAAYRKHPGGVWWESSNNIDEIWKKYGIPHLTLFVEIKKLYDNNPKRAAILDGQIDTMLGHLRDTDAAYATDLMDQAERKFPAEVRAYRARQATSKSAGIVGRVLKRFRR